MKEKRLELGYDDFKKVIEENLYYVDKTLMIKELLDSGGQAVLLTRPRRFGKTLNLSMLHRFFEDERTAEGEKIDNRNLFDGLAIMESGEAYLQHQQKYPVISISLKEAKQSTFEMSYRSILDDIIREFERHAYVLAGELPQRSRETFTKIRLEKAEQSDYAKALLLLSECLYKYHGQSVYLLIDEYDVPLENAYVKGFYEEMSGFIRSLFSSALKGNPYLKRGVITGCLRISRESIFTGLNNLEVHSLLSPYYSDGFGFTEEEVKDILNYYSLPEKFGEVKEWYDGYLFGSTEIYNPWSILSYVKMAVAEIDALPQAYWSNTSSNNIVRELVADADEVTRQDLEVLMDGGVIEKPIHEDITYDDVHASQDNLWNFLFFTGYLKADGKRMEGRKTYLSMSVPNEEIALIYEDSIQEWFKQRIEQIDRRPLIAALEEGDCKTAEGFIASQLSETISYFDYAENYYHGFISGLLLGVKGYRVLSNRESGTGRPDLILKTTAIRNGRAIILELKRASGIAEMEGKCKEALAQIEDMQYEDSLRHEGYPVIRKYAVCFCRKDCMIMGG